MKIENWAHQILSKRAIVSKHRSPVQKPTRVNYPRRNPVSFQKHPRRNAPSVSKTSKKALNPGRNP